MVVSILILLLIVVALSAMHFFLFSMFIPSLKAQHVDAEDPVFSAQELDFVSRHPDSTDAKTPGTELVPRELLPGFSDADEVPGGGAKVRTLPFWRKLHSLAGGFLGRRKN